MYIESKKHRHFLVKKVWWLRIRSAISNYEWKKVTEEEIQGFAQKESLFWGKHPGYDQFKRSLYGHIDLEGLLYRQSIISTKLQIAQQTKGAC